MDKQLLDIDSLEEVKYKRLEELEVQYGLKKNIDSLIAKLKDRGTNIIIVNGEYGIGKTTIIKLVTENLSNEKVKHIELWNLDYDIDKTSFLFHNILKPRKKNYLIMLFLSIYILYFYLNNWFVSTFILPTLILVIIIKNGKYILLIFSKIKLLPISFFYEFLWSEIEKEGNLYILEDVDRLDEIDQRQVFEFCNELSKRTQSSKILISLSTSNLSPKGLESMHKLEANILRISYDLESVISKAFNELSDQNLNTDLSECDYILAYLIWSGLKNSKYFKLEQEFRFVKYYKQNVSRYISAKLTYIDSLFSAIFEYYYGHGHISKQELLNDSFILEHVRLLLFEDYCMTNRSGFNDIFTKQNIEKIGYIGEKQIYKIPSIFSKYIRYKYEADETNYFYPIYHPIEKIINTFESENLKNILVTVTSEPEEKWDFKDYYIIDYLFQDMLLNSIVQKGYSISQEFVQYRNVFANKYYNHPEFNHIMLTSIIGETINELLGNYSPYVDPTGFNRSFKNTIMYKEKKISINLPEKEFWDRLWSNELSNYLDDGNKEKFICDIYSSIFSLDFKYSLTIYQLAIIVLTYPEVGNFLSQSNPVNKIVEIFKKTITEENINVLPNLVPLRYSSNEYLLNEVFQEGNLRHTCDL